MDFPKKAVMRQNLIRSGRPRIQVDFAIILRMREARALGWSRMAQEYMRLTGQYISRDTIKRRYLEAKMRNANGHQLVH